MKKLLSLTLCSIMILALCVMPASAIGAPNPNSKLSGFNGTANKKPITFTFWTADGVKDMPFTDPVAKEITKLTGVTLKVSYPVNGQGDQTIATMIASGDLPDLVYAKGSLTKFYDAGYLVKLDNYINKEGNNIKALYGKMLPRIRYSPQDPHYYSLGAYGVSSQIWEPGSPLLIQHAVLKELGYPKMNTIDDAEKALKAYMHDHPTVNGQKTIGISLLADDWRWLITVGNPAGAAAGYPDNGEWIIDFKTGEAQYKFLNPKLKTWFKWLNKLNSEGLLDPDSFTQKYDQYVAKLASGRVLGICDAWWEYNDAKKALLASNMPERTWATLPISIDAKTKNASMLDFGYSGGPGIAITTACKNPERAFQFLDWMASDYAQVLVNWGIYGKDYTYNAKGKRVQNPAIVKMSLTDSNFQTKTGIGQWIYPFPQRGDGTLDPTGNTYTTKTVDSIIQNYNSADKATLKAYGVKMYKDLFPPTSAFPVSPFGAAWQTNIPSDSQLNITLTNADKYCQSTLPKLVMGSPADFDKGWDDMISQLKAMGIDQADKDFTKLIQDKMKFWK